MFLSQFVENCDGIKSSIVTQLSGDDFECLSISRDQQLFFS